MMESQSPDRTNSQLLIDLEWGRVVPPTAMVRTGRHDDSRKQVSGDRGMVRSFNWAASAHIAHDRPATLPSET